MSPTSYRAAPPRNTSVTTPAGGVNATGLLPRGVEAYPGESQSGTLVGTQIPPRGNSQMSQLYVVVLAVIVVAMLSVARATEAKEAL